MSLLVALVYAPAMREFLQACRQAPSFARQRRTLERLVTRPELHARFLNTLARLEYVGVRKMLKARRADELDLDGLQHILEEAVHATRLKKLALSVAPSAAITTFSDAHTLAGDVAESYFQGIDAAAARLLEPNARDCYWLTSAAIEVRAHTFYPVYQELLTERGERLSIASIIGDEAQHLEAMAAELPSRVPGWRQCLTHVLAVEETGFCAWLDAVDAQLPA